MRIGELAEKHGLAASALRYYERCGLLTDIGRRSGARYYTESDDRRVAFIRLAQSAGFTVAEIRVLLHGFGDSKPSQRWQQTVMRKRADVLGDIARSQRTLVLLERLLDCDCPSLEACGDQYATRHTHSASQPGSIQNNG